MAAKKTVKVTVYRSAKTGRFVTEKYADNHKATTEAEKVTKPVQ